MKARWDIMAGFFSKPITFKNQQNGGYVFVLSECDTGYICSFEPYFGKPTTYLLPWPDQPFTGIVLHLVDKVAAKAQGNDYHIHIDRFHTSTPLAKELQDRQMHLAGTVQKNRKGLARLETSATAKS